MFQVESSLLRNALRANAAFSTICGLVLITRSQSLSSLLGISPAPILWVTGGLLIVFAADLAMNSLRQEINLRAAMTAVIMDVGWVVGSVILLLVPITGLTNAGWWAIAIVADIVAVFAVLQFVGLKKTHRAIG